MSIRGRGGYFCPVHHHFPIRRSIFNQVPQISNFCIKFWQFAVNIDETCIRFMEFSVHAC